MRRVALTLSALTATGLILTACGSSTSSTPAADPQQVKGGQTITQTWPLTGLDVASGKTASLDHPVLVAKMDNTVASQPQVGLSKADMVVEELVEGGLTRLAAFYYSDLPDNAGPIRSMRASDIPVVSPVHASMVTSGAAFRTIQLIKAAGIPFYTEGSKGFYRSDQRSAPYNLFAKITEVAQSAKAKPATPPDYLTWGSESDLPKGVKVTSFGAQFSGGHTTEWQFTNGTYHNLNTNAPPGDQFPATSVLVLRVREGNAGYLDPAGNPVPKTLLFGKGNALLFHNGRMIAGTWKKGKADSPITLTTKAGAALDVPAGHTWIELVPVDGGTVHFTKK